MSGNQQNRQATSSSNQQNRQDTYNNQWDNYNAPYYGGAVAAATVGAAAGYAAGASAAAAAPATPVYIPTLPCTPKVVAVGGVNYYQCGSTWYGQAYSGSGPTYVVVKPPSGQ
jgi:hypothetical protein